MTFDEAMQEAIKRTMASAIYFVPMGGTEGGDGWTVSHELDKRYTNEQKAHMLGSPDGMDMSGFVQDMDNKRDAERYRFLREAHTLLTNDETDNFVDMWMAKLDWLGLGVF